MKFERQYNFAYFCNLSVSTNKGTFILKNNMPDTIQFHIWYQEAKYPKTYALDVYFKMEVFKTRLWRIV